MWQVDIFLFIYLTCIVLVLAGQELETSCGLRMAPTDVNMQIISLSYTQRIYLFFYHLLSLVLQDAFLG